MTEGEEAETIGRFAECLEAHDGSAEQVEPAGIDMPPAFIKGVGKHRPRARITFDTLHAIAHDSTAVGPMRRIEQKGDASPKGMRWALLKDRDRLSAASRIDLDALVAKAASERTARARLYRGRLREILDRKQIDVVSSRLKQRCANVLRPKVEPTTAVASTIRLASTASSPGPGPARPSASSKPRTASSGSVAPLAGLWLEAGYNRRGIRPLSGCYPVAMFLPLQ